MSNEELVKLIKQGINVSYHMEQLYIQNKGLIFSAIKKYRYACQADHNSTPIIEMDELMNEAYFGLVKAVESYDESQGILFMSYAPCWIRQVVKRYLDNCGRVVRVPIHRQAEIYKYNQVRARFLQNINREPSIQEYAYYLGVSPKVVEDLQRYMFQDKIQSLDFALPGNDNEDLTAADSVASDIDLEGEVVERISQKQLKNELWDMVAQVLKHDDMVGVLRYRFIDRLTLEETGERLGLTRERVRQYENNALRRLRCNSKSKKLISYLVA
jgi:RNA polymerase primary sigma factor